jgi:3',5'-cyclic AMP phosphodiesterase CpdA
MSPSPSPAFRLAIISDIHYAGPAEQARLHRALDPIQSRGLRWLTRQYRHWLWLRDPGAHNHLLDRFIEANATADFVVANGDFSCDSAYIGVADDAAFESASLGLGKLRGTLGLRFAATMGDHEIGKTMLAADAGGLRLTSFHRAAKELGIEPFWKRSFGHYVLIGITSSLVALPVYEAETLSAELPVWRELRERHLEEIRRAFAALRPEQRVLLFCHDPTALPFLWQEARVRAKLSQVERTIIGHLHSPLLLKQSLILAGLPTIKFLGHTPRRLSAALRQARLWRPFHLLLCPSPPGIQLFKDGGYYTADLDLEAQRPAAFQFHPLKW